MKIEDLKTTVKNGAFTPTPICTVVGQVNPHTNTLVYGVKAEEKQICQQISNSPAICKLVWGFTLIEALIALAILTMVAAGLIIPFASSTAVSQQGCNQTLAAKLAADLIEQIINTDFSQIVSRYNGYNEQKGQVKDAAGVVFSDPMYADFSRQAVCEYVFMPPQQSFGTPNFIKITVSVYQNGLKLAEVTRLKSK